MNGGCDFHVQTRGDCIHCLGFELALARKEVERLHEWIRHLTEGDDPPVCTPHDWWPVQPPGVIGALYQCSRCGVHTDRPADSSGAESKAASPAPAAASCDASAPTSQGEEK